MMRSVILCVDDEPGILENLKIGLQKTFGYAHLIETAQDAEEALALTQELKDEDCEIPVIISDYIMPGMKGDKLLERIHELMPNTRTIMLTGQASADKKRLRQVLLNLLINAIKFTHQGEVRLLITCHQEQLQFAIHDTGTGIAAADLDKVFYLFSNSNNISSRVTFSIGVACLQPQMNEMPLTLIEMADKALYEAKEKGRNVIVLYQ